MFLSIFYAHFEKKSQNHIISIKINIFETVSKSARNFYVSGGLFCIQLDGLLFRYFSGLRVQAQNTAILRGYRA